MPYAVTLKRKPNVLLAWNLNSTTTTATLPTNYTDWDSFLIVTRWTSGDDEFSIEVPISALAANFTYDMTPLTRRAYGFRWNAATRVIQGGYENMDTAIVYLELR